MQLGDLFTATERNLRSDLQILSLLCSDFRFQLLFTGLVPYLFAVYLSELDPDDQVNCMPPPPALPPPAISPVVS